MEIDNLNEMSFAQAKSALMDALEDSEFIGVETIIDDLGEENVGLRFSNDTLLIITEFLVVSRTYDKNELN